VEIQLFQHIFLVPLVVPHHSRTFGRASHRVSHAPKR